VISKADVKKSGSCVKHPNMTFNITQQSYTYTTLIHFMFGGSLEICVALTSLALYTAEDQASVQVHHSTERVRSQ